MQTNARCFAICPHANLAAAVMPRKRFVWLGVSHEIVNYTLKGTLVKCVLKGTDFTLPDTAAH